MTLIDVKEVLQLVTCSSCCGHRFLHVSSVGTAAFSKIPKLLVLLVGRVSKSTFSLKTKCDNQSWVKYLKSLPPSLPPRFSSFLRVKAPSPARQCAWKLFPLILTTHAYQIQVHGYDDIRILASIDSEYSLSFTVPAL